MNLTAIIKTFQRPAVAQRLVDSIRTRYPSLPILIADDSEEDHQYAGANLLRLPFNVGLSAGRNRLLEAVETEYFLLLDDDHVFNENPNLEKWLLALEDNGYDLLAGFVVEFREVKAAFYGTFELVDGSHLLMHREQHLRDENGILQCHYTPNFFIAKTKQIKELGAWKEELKLEEHWEFFYRVYQKIKIGYYPAVSVDHRRETSESYSKFRDDSENIDAYRKKGKAMHGIEKLSFILRGENIYSF